MICTRSISPCPVEFRTIPSFSWSGGKILVHLRLNGLNSFFLFHLPCQICVRDMRCVTFAVENKSDTVAHLTDSSAGPKIPNRRCQNIFSGLQQRSEIVRLIPPMRQIAVTRSATHPSLI